jgi:holo-[acyl-carrier protein] synthase
VSVVGLGLDLVETDRVARSLARWGERLVQKLMDPEEAAALPTQPRERALALAHAIAAKEAASKAIGTGWSRGVRWRDVPVSLGPDPCVRFLNRAALHARRVGSEGRHRLRFELRDGLLLAELRLLG